VLEDLRDRVGDGEAGDVAGAEDRGHAAGRRAHAGLFGPRPGEGRRVARIDAAHRRREAAVDGGVKQARLGQHVHADERHLARAAADGGERSRRPGGPRHAPRRDVRERSGRDQEQPQRGDRPGRHFLGGGRRGALGRLDR
jgi:hypothetical protein